MKYFILFINIYLTCIYSERTPQIVRITENQTVDIGGTTELSCSVLYSDGYAVVWQKLEKETNELNTLSSDTTPIMRDSRMSLRYDTASTTYTLQIKDIQNSDAGIYKCTILISTNNYISKEVTLQVNSPPIIYDNSSSTMIVSENNPVSLECYAGGIPKPLISWKRENNAILPSGGTVYRGNILKINNVQKEDRGTYYCTAHNNVGKSVKRSIAVEIEFPPIVRASKSTLQQALNFDVDLGCRIEAFPDPVINWLKDGYLITNNKHYRIEQLSIVGEYKDSTLLISSIKPNQYGIYVCRAVNKLGQAEAQIQLYESESPVCPPACGSGHYGSGMLLTPNSEFIFIVLIITCFMYS
ncbi:hypothetical protein PGB90_003156 [Kerria lacca]